MKPISKRKQNWIHAGVWLLICLLPLHFIFFNLNFDLRLLIGYFSRVILFFIIFYANYIYLIDRFLLNRKIVEYFLINLIMIILLNLGLYILDLNIIHPILRDLDDGKQFKPISFGMRMTRDVVSNFLVVVGLSIGTKMLQKWFEDNTKMKELQAEQSKAELQQLKSQINPHFLFNTLNNIYSLVAIDQAKAQKAIHKLSNLLRYTLYDNNLQFVPLNKELDFIRNYIDLMKLRLSDNVQFTVDIDNGDSEDKIAPLIFITIIENAFKHGISNVNDSFINIQIIVQPKTKVICKVENSCYPAETEDRSGSGIGLRNTIRRLEILYPKKHVIKLGETTDKTFLAYMEIDLT